MRAAGHQRAQRRRHLDLAAMAAQRMDARIERRVGALGGIGRERAGDQRRLEHALDREQRRQRLGGGELRAVEQREPFLRAEHERREAGARQRRVGRHALAGEVRPRRSPSIAAAMCASGARSPEAPTEPWLGITGMTPRASIASQHARASPAARRRRRAPRLASFSAIISRTVAGAHRLADAGRVREHDVALQRGRDRPAAMRTLASLPKPVLMP